VGLFLPTAGLTEVERIAVQIDYDVVHLRTSLVQLFVLLQLNFEEVVQIIELRRFGGAPNGYPFAALREKREITGSCLPSRGPITMNYKASGQSKWRNSP
jgi:hypothetical protein